MPLRTVQEKCESCGKRDRPCTVVTIGGKNQFECMDCYRSRRGTNNKGETDA